MAASSFLDILVDTKTIAITFGAMYGTGSMSSRLVEEGSETGGQASKDVIPVA